MTDLRKAAEQALEALESVYGKGKRCEAAIKKLRQVLEEPTNSTTGFVEPKASSQTEQHLKFEGPIHVVCQCDKCKAQPEQEPVAQVVFESVIPDSWVKCVSIKWFKKPTEGPLYTAPPKREWVGLTEDEVTDCFLDSSEKGILIEEAIEAKLKEKNT